MSRVILSAFVLLLVVAAVEAAKGLDVSSSFPQKAWDCIVGRGYEFAIVRCYRSLNIVDDNCAESVARAWAAGMKHVDLYMFPCPKCGDYEGQVKKLDDHIRSHNITYGQIWIDIEGADKYWHSDKSKNREIFNALCQAATDTFGTRFAGLYVSHHSWKNILGLDYKEWGNLKVWYAYWDKEPGMGHWEPYGSFTKPTMHQYSGDYKECDMKFDRDWNED